MKGKYYCELYDGSRRRSLCLRTDNYELACQRYSAGLKEHGRKSVLSMRLPSQKSGWPGFLMKWRQSRISTKTPPSTHRRLLLMFLGCLLGLSNGTPKQMS